MAAPALSQVLAMDAALKKVYENAITEFMDTITPEMSIYEVREVAVAIAAKYQMLGSRLGALWYDVCAELAGLRLDPAEMVDVDLVTLEKKVAEAQSADELTDELRAVIYDAWRQTGRMALQRDYSRGLAGGKWCRVPVGETCAWCIMLASNGAWYLSEETALGKEAGHYHNHCDCIAVYYANAEEIEGYTALGDYKAMFYAADQARERGEYSPEVAQRILDAKARHEREYDEGVTATPWTDYNATMIIMREMFGLK